MKKQLKSFFQKAVRFMKDAITIVQFFKIIRDALPFLRHVILIIWISMMGEQ